MTKAFATAWPDALILQQLAAKIPWGQNTLILQKVKAPQQRQWYIQKTIEHGWNCNVLSLQIDGVSTYKLRDNLPPKLKTSLPNPEQLGMELEAAATELEQRSLRSPIQAVRLCPFTLSSQPIAKLRMSS
ncbi:MAG: DUF1016 N-terminal domain-containing protein [Leptolyngbyaceae cyanobacterium]